ncbi:P27 family phage terminase small subunit [Agreia sp. PsM10]|uniref:P27 family phage terminase small subunit n=1 Tax=Agreia sp. PsM10 TaxID=3030533 RepID=UPI00263A9CE9|nr:P27 family phage terminase small subunit [Agreia sp. PsM10]MDN4639700.1 P27 family phage terminase small subunit [Agreia sp. PsM10]
MAVIPRILKDRGRKLWRDLQREAEFDPHETPVLLETCRTVDTIDALADAIERDGVMITGSQGQSVINPAVAELRQQQQSLARLMGILNLDSIDSVASLQTLASIHGRAAANARHSKRNRA